MLAWIGITNVTYEIMPWDSLIPALQAEQIDIIADNIHETPDRIKVISFTGPAWWYGPALIVTSDNPDNIQSYDDLTRDGVTVGAVSGSAAAEYLNFIGADVTTFKDNTAEFAAAEQGRVSVILEDDTKFAAYQLQNDSTNLVALDVDAPAILISEYGYSYARYGLRQSDCTLNFAYTRALAEMRASGEIGEILEQFGLPKDNVVFARGLVIDLRAAVTTVMLATAARHLHVSHQQKGRVRGAPTIDWALVRESLPALLEGLKITVELTFIVIVISLILGVFVALGRLSKNRAIRIVTGFYVDFMRATPLLLQLIYIYFVLPTVGIRRSICRGRCGVESQLLRVFVRGLSIRHPGDSARSA